MTLIANIRTDYKKQSLSENDVDKNPVVQFDKWWADALHSEITEVNAMTLATATPDGKPSARIVLLKGFDENGFVFFTNYNSRKGNELLNNPQAALVFFWKELERQVRIEGTIAKINEADSDTYFASRPANSQIGAWASPQSTIIPGRQILEDNMIQYNNQFGENIPRPAHWGGYIIQPVLMEFWQGRPDRLHDRIQYTLNKSSWTINRLAP
ncbi:MAG: pyridoxamine 5'-phosphate oxidase [Chitinophagaceae bacterium]|nr:pyridoxamine 5'-phosphate oxidase [Chitinophagaceae bacterium]